MLGHQDGSHAEDAAKLAATDLGRAERLILRHGEAFRFVPEAKQWIHFDGSRWVPDVGDTLIMRAAQDTARAIYEEVPLMEDKEARLHRARFASASESDRALNATVRQARFLPGVPVRLNELDSNPWLFNVANGTLDLRFGELRPHNRADLITVCSEVSYVPDAPCSTWERFLEDVLPDPDVREFVQRAVGYSLTGTVEEQVLFFTYGIGKNGKSTFLGTLESLMGDYWTKARAETLMKKSNSDAIPNDVAALKGKRLVTVSELDQGQRFNESLIKDLTGGDPITARFLHREFFTFSPTFKVWLYGNHKPAIRGTDEGIWRRPKLIPFTVCISEAKRDPRLGTKLHSELPGILAWAIRGCLAWQTQGLGEPAAVAAATAEYRKEMDVLSAFVEECCETGEGYRCGASELYHAFRRYCDAAGERSVPTQTDFGRQLASRGYDKTTSGIVYRLGIRLSEALARTPYMPPQDLSTLFGDGAVCN